MIKGTELEGDDVVTILRKAHNTNQGLFNNAAQSFNHEFYWQSMKPGGGGKPTGKLAELIDRDFGSYDNFRKEFTTAALTGMNHYYDSHGYYDWGSYDRYVTINSTTTTTTTTTTAHHHHSIIR